LFGYYPGLELLGVDNVDEIVELFSDAFADLYFLFIFLALNEMVFHAGQFMGHPELLVLNADEGFIFLFN